jgi:large subunit ribosomal protein L19e
MANLNKKKELAAKTLKVGKNRLVFNQDNLAEIKEAITRQDIKDLHAEGIITIKPVKGRTKVTRRKTRRGPGKIKKTVNKRKQIYVKVTRKLRAYLSELKKLGVIDRELYIDLRKKIRMRVFRSKAHLKEYLESNGDIGIKPHELVQQIQKERAGSNKKSEGDQGKKSKVKKEVKKPAKSTKLDKEKK